MPIFPYICPSCHCKFELIRKYCDMETEVCPSCGGTVDKSNRVVGSMSFELKGTGWAKDNYALGPNKYKFQS